MNKIYLYFILVILVVIIAAGFVMLKPQEEEAYMPVLTLTGDVEEELVLSDYNFSETISLDYKEQQLEVVELQNIISKSQPVTDSYDIILSAQDGLRAELDGDSIDKSYLHFSNKNGWETIHLNHPRSSNIKHLEEIIINAQNNKQAHLFSIISPEQNLFLTSPGQLRQNPVYDYPIFEGTSTVNKEEQNYSVSIFQQKKVVKAEELINREIEGRALVVGDRGEFSPYDGGLFEIKGNKIDYLNQDGDTVLNNSRGLIINPPVRRISDVFHDTLHYLEQEERVMILLLDGFSFPQYIHAAENGFLPFLATKDKPERALSVYRPVSNAGLAAILTGTGPEENGVYDRSRKDLLTDDIFQQAAERDLKSQFIEGYIKILNTSIEPVLNPGKGEDGTTDRAVFNSTLKYARQDYNLIFAHFHGIDDLGHTYGPRAEETMKKIEETDNYVQELANIWPGKVIITSDHGMRAIENGEKAGDHGELLYQDMFVPYIIIEGGQNNE